MVLRPTLFKILKTRMRGGHKCLNTRIYAARKCLWNSSGSNYSAGRRYGCIEAPFYDWRCSHTSLAGVAGGMIAGINPVAGAIAALFGWCSFALRSAPSPKPVRACRCHCDGSWYGLAGVLSGFVPNSSSFAKLLCLALS